MMIMFKSFITTFEVLKFTDFRNRWFASFLKNAATSMLQTAAIWMILSLSQNASLTALIPVALSLPTVIFLIPAGITADLYSKRYQLLMSLSLSGLILIVIGLISMHDLLQPVSLLALLGLYAVINSFVGPAWHGSITDIVPKNYVRSAVSLQQVSFSSAAAFGSVFSGIFILLVGPELVFWISGTANIVMALIIRNWKEVKPIKELSKPLKFEKKMLWKSYIESIRNAPSVGYNLTYFMLVGLLCSGFFILIPLFNKTFLTGKEITLGLMYGCYYLGGVFGSFFASQKATSTGLIRRLSQGILLIAIGYASIPFFYSGYWALICIFEGYLWMYMIVVVNGNIQLAAHKEYKARTMTLFILTSFASMAIGGSIYAILIDSIGMIAVVWGLALLLAPFLLLFLFATRSFCFEPPISLTVRSSNHK